MVFSKRSSSLLIVLLVLTGCGGGKKEEVATDTARTSVPSAAGTTATDAPPVTPPAATDSAADPQVTISPGGAPDSTKKYGVKSGIVEYWNSVLNRHQTLYFDDYGAKEAYYTDPELGGSSSKPPFDVSIYASGWRYDYSTDTRTGVKQKKNMFSGPLLGTIQDVWALPEQYQEQFSLKKLGKKTMMGKTADGYFFQFNGKTTVWLWEGIPLHVEIRRPGAGKEDVMTFEATTVSTDVPVPPEKFVVPATIALTER